jgi:hypothetical protein
MKAFGYQTFIGFVDAPLVGVDMAIHSTKACIKAWWVSLCWIIMV